MQISKMLVTLAVILASPVVAQTQPVPVPAPTQDVFFIGNGAPVMPFAGKIDVLRSFGAVSGHRVQDKPYSASSITESVQILADGNKIVHRNEARIYRDSAGRTRREQTVNALGAWQPANDAMSMITIDDPVAEVSYFLNPNDKTARQLRTFKLAKMGAAVQWEAAVPVTAPLPPGGPPSAGVAIRTERIDAGPGAPAVQEFEVAVPAPPPGALTSVRTYAPGAGGVVHAFGGGVASHASGASTRSEDLGEQILEGLLVRGSREIQTIPAGAIGNQRAIEIVYEQWYSPDIEAVVFTKSSDPRFGETIYQLTNVARTEPPPDLFALPQDYQLVTEETVGPGQRIEFAPTTAPPANAGRRVMILQTDPPKDD